MDVVLVWFFLGSFCWNYLQVTYGLFGIAYELFCGLLTSYLWLVWNCLRSPLQVTLRFVWNLIGITYEVPSKVICSLLTSNFKFAWDYLRSPYVETEGGMLYVAGPDLQNKEDQLRSGCKIRLENSCVVVTARTCKLVLYKKGNGGRSIATFPWNPLI